MSLQNLGALCEGLSSVNVEEVQQRIITEGGLRGAARYYGASYETYSHHLLAGRLGFQDLMNTIDGQQRNASSIAAYVERCRKILRPEIIKYLETNEIHFQPYVDAADKQFAKDFDWLMLMSHETSYLLRDKYNGGIIETPALMHLRVTAELFYQMPDEDPPVDCLAEALICYEMATSQYFCFASPVFFNSGHKSPNLCSCFLMNAEDSLTGIMSSMYKAALISKAKGGIGLNVSGLRHSGIGHDGHSGGVIPMLQVYDRLIRYVDQTGKRNGASTVFLQAHHIDLMAVIRSTLKNADSNNRLDGLNTAIVFPDLFWERLKTDSHWTLFCPAIFPGLNESYGAKYRELYLKYETMTLDPRNEAYRIRIPAREVIETLADSQIMSGMPYVLHKDSINSCSNQVNLNSDNPLHHRIIQSSNLCLEIMEQADSEEVACCNLGQLSLKAFVQKNKDGDSMHFNFTLFGYVVRAMVKLLDRVIDRNKYVFPEAKTSNMRHRPIGLGVSGYADMLDILRIPYESEEASALSRKMFACLYYNAMTSSLELSLKSGPYSTFYGSPLSEGKFAFDLWRTRRAELAPDAVELPPVDPCEWGQENLYLEGPESIILAPSWDELRSLVVRYGVRNSQMIAIMPSASTSRLMGNTENTEAHQSNLYIRNFMRASAVIINPQLFKELDGELHLWSRDVSEFIISQGGSVARLPDFLMGTASDEVEKTKIKQLAPELASLCARYKTMFEIKQLKILQQVAERHRYICQAISYNVYLQKPTRAMLKKLHMSTHAANLKTGMYYLRENEPSSTPEYARTSRKVLAFLSGPPMPLLTIHHEPFPVHNEPVTIVSTLPVPQLTITAPPLQSSAVELEEVDESKNHQAFNELLAREDIELIVDHSPHIEEESSVSGAACVRAPGCVSCGS